MKSNMFGFRGYSQMKFYKTYKTAKNGLVWFGKGMYCMLMSYVQSMFPVSDVQKLEKFC